MMKSAIRSRIVAALLTVAAMPASSHHSFAMFDSSRTVTFKGSVKELQWTNPHVWLTLTVQEQSGPVAYNFEGAAIAVLKRVGWTRDLVKTGDVVTVVGHPYKDGRAGGSIDHLVLADGRKIGTGDAFPPAYVVPGVQ